MSVANERGDGHDLDIEEVRGEDVAEVRSQKRRPLRRALRGGVKAAVGQDTSDGRAAQPVAEHRQRPSNAGVHPRGVLAGEFHHEPADLLGNARTPPSSALRTIVFLGDELALPAKQGVGSDKRVELVEEAPARRPR